MLCTTNKVVTIERLLDTSWEKDYDTTVISWLALYLEPLDDTIWVNIDGEWAFEINKLFSSFLDIQVSDKITDQDSIIYIVKWVKKYDSLVWSQLECIVQAEYD